MREGAVGIGPTRHSKSRKKRPITLAQAWLLNVGCQDIYRELSIPLRPPFSNTR
jgi:hypothetical protein